MFMKLVLTIASNLLDKWPVYSATLFDKAVVYKNHCQEYCVKL